VPVISNAVFHDNRPATISSVDPEEILISSFADLPLPCQLKAGMTAISAAK